MLTTHSDGVPTASGVLRVQRRHEERKKDPEFKPLPYEKHAKNANDASVAANTSADHLKSRAHQKAKSAHTTAAKHAPTAKLVNLHTQMALAHHQAAHVTTKKYRDDVEKQHKVAQDAEKTQQSVMKTEADAKKAKAEADLATAKKSAPAPKKS